MKMRRTLATGLAVAMMLTALPIGAMAGEQTATLGGTGKKEAKKPYTDFSARARNSQSGDIAGTTPLDVDANFTLANLPPASYVVELLNKDGKVVCTEGPYDLAKQLAKTDVDVNCNKVPVAWWLLGVAAAAGITAGIVSANASPSR
jgi:hypothetical protein